MTNVPFHNLMVMWKDNERMDVGLAFMISFFTFLLPSYSVSCQWLVFSVVTIQFFVKLWYKTT